MHFLFGNHPVIIITIFQHTNTKHEHQSPQEDNLTLKAVHTNDNLSIYKFINTC